MNRPSPEEFREELVRIGLEAEHFQRSRVGQYMLDRARNQMDDAMVERMQCSPNDEDGNKAAQLKYLVGQSIVEWIEEAVRSGRNAEREIIEEDDLGE